MGFESIVKRINSLPPLPESVRKLEELFSAGEPDMQAIVSVIESDPVLTADILAKVNAPIYSYSKQIVSVMQAVTLFGLATLRGMVLESSMQRNFDIDMSPYGISNEMFSKISAMQSALMFQWYMGVDVERAKVLVPIAFLMETGKVVIAKEMVESSYGDTFYHQFKESKNIQEVERDYTDTTSYEVSGLLFEHWFFDETFIETISRLDRPDEISEEYKDMVNALNIVRTAVNVKEPLTEESIENAVQIVGRSGLDTKRFLNAAGRVREKFK